MKFLIEIISFVSAAIIALFALSQAWLALYYKWSKTHASELPQQPKWQGDLPRILLQLPIYNERYVIDRLLNAVAQLDYPQELLTIQLLDDSTDETSVIAAATIAKWARQGVKIDHIRRIDRRGYKAGAMQAGMKLDNSEFITIFDADFIPRPEFLKQIIGYFNDSKIGMVQTRWEHLNGEYSLLTKLLSFAIDAHFSVEQGGRQAAHSFINFNGTAGMWRRKAIEEAGGWEDDCLTEDLDLSFRAQLLGWHFLFVEGIGTPSELPAQMSAIRTQQFRWTKGAAETGKKILSHLWSSKYSLLTKVIGSFHMLNSFVFPFMLLLSVIVIFYPFVFGEQAEARLVPISILLSIALAAILFMYWTAHTFGQFKSEKKGTVNILFRAFLFMMMISGLSLHNGLAVLQGMIGRVTPFVRTPKLNVLTPENKILGKGGYKGASFKLLNWIEIAMCFVFSGLIVYCYNNNQFSLIPIYTYFAFGYGMVSFFTLQEIHSGYQAAHEVAIIEP
jgi:cellulose synthase/poly-beta-1,6-N-acetylglucosamine synthase-like glycosyltransferase